MALIVALLKTRHIAVVVCGVILLAGCSTTSLKLDSASIPQAQLDDLLTGEVFLGHKVAASELPEIDVLSVDKDMKSFLDRYVLQYKYKKDRVQINPLLILIGIGKSQESLINKACVLLEGLVVVAEI